MCYHTEGNTGRRRTEDGRIPRRAIMKAAGMAPWNPTTSLSGPFGVGRGRQGAQGGEGLKLRDTTHGILGRPWLPGAALVQVWLPVAEGHGLLRT